MFSRATINGQPLDGFKLKRGDDFDVNLLIYDAGQTTATIQFIAKKSIDDPDDDAVITKTSADITVAVTGNVLSANFAIASIETKALDGGLELIYGFQRKLGGKTKTIEEGSFSIEADVLQTN